jgi:hypothetical protein
MVQSEIEVIFRARARELTLIKYSSCFIRLSNHVYSNRGSKTLRIQYALGVKTDPNITKIGLCL